MPARRCASPFAYGIDCGHADVSAATLFARFFAAGTFRREHVFTDDSAIRLVGAHVPPPAALPATGPAVSYTHELRTSEDKMLLGRAMHARALPVAIPASIRNANSFFVQRLDGGQPLPAGMVQAVLVLTNEIEDILELADRLREVDRATKKP
jgi:hypothetical protein